MMNKDLAEQLNLVQRDIERYKNAIDNSQTEFQLEDMKPWLLRTSNFLNECITELTKIEASGSFVSKV